MKNGNEAFRQMRGKILLRLGWFYSDTGMWAKALSLINEAMDLLKSTEWTYDILLAYLTRSLVQEFLGDQASARESGLIGLRLSEESNENDWAIGFYYILAWDCYVNGKYQDSLVWAEKMTQPGQHFVKGVIYKELGDYSKAHKHLLKQAEHVGYHRFGAATAYSTLSEISILTGDIEAAWTYLQRSIQFVDEHAYAWIALEVLQQATIRLFMIENQFLLAVEVIALIVNHPAAMKTYSF